MAGDPKLTGAKKKGYGGRTSANPKSGGGGDTGKALLGPGGNNPRPNTSTHYPLQRSSADNRSTGTVPPPITRRSYQGSKSKNPKS